MKQNPKKTIYVSSVLMSDVVKKTSTCRRSRIPCLVVEKNYDASTWRRRSRRRKKRRKSTNFKQKLCDLLTAITHTEIPCALYTTNKQENKIMKAKRSMFRW